MKKNGEREKWRERKINKKYSGGQKTQIDVAFNFLKLRVEVRAKNLLE